MNVAVLCVGRLREPGLRETAAEYRKRLRRYGSFEEVEVPDLPEPAKPTPALLRQVMDAEAERLLRALRPTDRVIALCVDGKTLSSEAFAAHLTALQAQGVPRTVLVIGGSLGLGEALLARADERLSLSAMTLPHQLARVVLWEQLYRACKIRAGERYHK
ncbi:MAG: 23S rRNA (pseudouridine(1915)-N(3))-methyltransferase RlmH [Oscillospiraceae bacterium]|nr:23S rRNA (pseudouridine(1915)-N(3))-methyltransferase RlmH [Oscillospiraceae bacterium]